MAKNNKPALTLERTWPWILTIAGSIAWLAAFIIMVEKIHLLKNPAYVPECNLNPIISCGSVMATVQSNAFGFPNPILGIAGFAVIITIGVLLLNGLRPERVKRWFWLGLQLGTIFGVLFVHWLFFQSVYRIGALCPYCMVVWVCTITIFWYTTLYNLRTGIIKTPKGWQKFVGWLQRHHGDILFVWLLLIATAILTHFWYYWKTLI